MKNTDIKELKKRLHEISHLSGAAALLSWDQEILMPEGAGDARAESSAYLASIIHQKFVHINDDKLLTRLHTELKNKKLSPHDSLIVSETWKSFQKESKFSQDFVYEMSELCSKSQQAWTIARSKNDFKTFLPYLEKMVVLKKTEAEILGYKGVAYDALLDSYEPGLTSGEVSAMLQELKEFLVPFVARIKASKIKINKNITKGSFDIDSQIKFNTMIASQIGFDFKVGRFDQSTHPFTTNFHPTDVRITTRYKKEDAFYAIGSTIHEAGHGMYEQGLPKEYFGTPHAEYVSLGIHESQSRFWEQKVGSSLDFWKYFYPKLQKQFPKPFSKIDLEKVYKVINKVEPSLIRTESDEVTYNLHIIIRFEIEKGLIEGSIKAKDVPKVWKQKVKEYLGIDVPSDTLGCLQDVHWSCGLFGYFPTYTLGNLYAAQFHHVLKKEIPSYKKLIAKGEFTPVVLWMRKNIHVHGKAHSADELVKKITGETLSSKYFVQYLEEKYGEIYKL